MKNFAVFPCPAYEPRLLSEVVQQVFTETHLENEIDFQNKKVFLKVNLLGAYPPEKAVTTHPLFVEAVAKAFKERGAEVYIGDSPGGFPKPVYMDKVFQTSGMTRAAAAAEAKIVNLSASKTIKKKINNRFVQELYLPQIIFEMDYLISLPKIKTHLLTLLTGAVKNQFGIIPGYYKSEIHKMAPRAEEISEILVDLYDVIPPVFVIADAVTIMEGEGPSGGRASHLGVVLAGENATEIDAAAAYLMGYDPAEIFTLSIAQSRGLGKIGVNELLGQCPELKLYRRHFKLPRLSLTRQLMEQTALLSGGVVKPKVYEDKCQLCQFCVESCPTKAISVQDKKIRFDYDECIRCLCCHELCPHQAMYLERSLFARSISFTYRFYQNVRKVFVSDG